MCAHVDLLQNSFKGCKQRSYRWDFEHPQLAHFLLGNQIFQKKVSFLGMKRKIAIYVTHPFHEISDLNTVGFFTSPQKVWMYQISVPVQGLFHLKKLEDLQPTYIKG